MEKIFISYSWDSVEHKEKVISFVAFLRKNGFNATCDEAIMQEESSIHFGKMMVSNIQFSDKVIVVLSPGYKQKADTDTGGVGTEYGYILSEITKRKNKYILVSFERLNSTVIEKITPFGIENREIIDLVADEEKGFGKLFSKLSNQPMFNLPAVADKKPTIKEKKIGEFKLDNSKENIQEAFDYYDMYFFDTPTKFFDHRLSQAFPGIRGIQWFSDPKDAIKRLEVLLRNPLNLERNERTNNPIWWFRGYSSLHIERFDLVNDEKCLINNMECLINKICVYRSSRYDRSFIYVELKPEPSIRVYNHDEVYISRMMKKCGYANEEYGVYKEHFVTREEYDDGAKFINNQLVNLNTKEVALRVRFLSRYNFIICAIFNPINSHDADTFFESYLNDMLYNTGNIEEVVKFVENLPRHKSGYQ